MDFYEAQSARDRYDANTARIIGLAINSDVLKVSPEPRASETEGGEERRRERKETHTETREHHDNRVVNIS